MTDFQGNMTVVCQVILDFNITDDDSVFIHSLLHCITCLNLRIQTNNCVPIEDVIISTCKV